MDKIIEPSEIIVEQDYVKTKPARANPWIRFLARFFDYSLFFPIFLFLHFPFGAYQKLVPFEFLAWVPLEALLLSTWGTTPGKWFLRTHLRFGRKPKPDYGMALRRSFSVWFRGLGLAIPFLDIVCLLVAYQRLKLTQTTSWDRDDHVHVFHDPIPRWRLVAATIVATGGLLIYFSIKNRGLYTS